MLTYQLRERTLRVGKADTLDFPNDVEIEFTFCPSEALGMVTGQGRTAIRGDTIRISYNANTGRQYVTSLELLKPLEVTIKYKGFKIELAGNKLHILTHCATGKDLIELIESVYYMLPSLLNLDFLDSPMIELTCGKVGNVSFSWEHKQAVGAFDVTTQEIQEKRVVVAWNRMTLLSRHSARRRLLAALQYFYIACRLSEAGTSPSEFMAEIILNYCKILEVLFPPSGNGQTRDAPRQGLKKLNYSEEEIERDFLPAMALRNEIDVGHVKLSLFSQAQLNILHRYTDAAEGAFRSMLQRLLAKIESGYDVIPKDPTGVLDLQTANIIQRLTKYFGT